MAQVEWNLHLLHDAVRGADNGVKQLTLTATEALFREWTQKNKPATFIHKKSNGVDVTVRVHPNSRGSNLPKAE